jgi:diguanylate cyclase (GGDEF)-like protein/PAS domain S-box-containing protein
MSETHRLVERQMRRLGLSPDRPPDAAEWAEFVGRVSTAYTEADQAQYIDKRALALSSQEMRDLYDRHRRAEARLSAVFDAVDVGLCVVDTDGAMETVNPMLAAAAGGDAAGLVGKRLWDVLRIYDADDTAQHKVIVDEVLLRLVASSGADWTGDDVVVDLGNGQAFPAAVAITPLVVDRRAIGTVMVVQDLTERKRAEADLHWQATHDALTGLPTRSHFMDVLANALSHGDRDVSVLYCDLDHFKEVNDTYGHAAGDDLLARAASRIRDALRDGDIVARLSGDEFAVLTYCNSDSAAGIGARIVSVLDEPFAIQVSASGELCDATVSASVGSATAGPLSTPAQLLSDADTAMYLAKQQGRGQVRVFGDVTSTGSPPSR